MGMPTAPGDVESALADAVSRGDEDAYVRALAGTDTFTYVRREAYDQEGDGAPLLTYGGSDGDRYLTMFTRGELLPRREQLVACRVTPAFMLSALETQAANVVALAVNAGTESEMLFDRDARRIAHWAETARGVPRRGHDDDALRTRRDGPRRGPLAHGLACGAHLAVHNQVFWNEIGDVYNDYGEDVHLLRDSWGVTDRDGWLEQLGYLMEGRNSPDAPEFALRVRRSMAGGGVVTPGTWRDAAARVLREHGQPAEAVDEVTDVIGRIVRYESRFRADGLLPFSGYVTSALGYDYGRAVNFARWGLGARYADPDEVERVVVRAGELCRAAYGTWRDFSAGYILGRVLRFDEESFGHMYRSALSPHRILTETAGSPWQDIPFHLGGDPH